MHSLHRTSKQVEVDTGSSVKTSRDQRHIHKRESRQHQTTGSLQNQPRQNVSLQNPPQLSPERASIQRAHFTRRHIHQLLRDHHDLCLNDSVAGLCKTTPKRCAFHRIQDRTLSLHQGWQKPKWNENLPPRSHTWTIGRSLQVRSLSIMDTSSLNAPQVPAHHVFKKPVCRRRWRMIRPTSLVNSPQ